MHLGLKTSDFRMGFSRFSQLLKCTMLVRRIPRNAALFACFGGLGDDLLTTIALREFKRLHQTPVWMMTNAPSLFAGNTDVDGVLPSSPRFIHRIAPKLGFQTRVAHFHHNSDLDQSQPPTGHILESICRQMNIHGIFPIRPLLHLNAQELSYGSFSDNQIAIQPSGAGGRHPMLNKEWFPDRFQAVVDALQDRFDFVQVGSSAEPLLRGVLDLRGKTTVRQTASVLRHSLVFVGLAGFVMHLARAVDRRSVIVYGGREWPTQTGYSCNINVVHQPPCSPCWRRNQCTFGRECMKRITSNTVIEAVVKLAKLVGGNIPLEVDLVDVKERPVAGSLAPGIGQSDAIKTGVALGTTADLPMREIA